mgnify:CR=1 FL=1
MSSAWMDVMIAVRYLRRHSRYTALTVIGLALGIGLSILLLLVAEIAFTFDRFHPRPDDIQLVHRSLSTEHGTTRSFSTGGWLWPAMQDAFSQVDAGTRFDQQEVQLARGDRRFNESLALADASFFEVFGFPLATGNPASVFQTANAVVLTPAAAAKYFGDTSPIGKTLTVDNRYTLTVTGVFDDLDRFPSILEFDVLARIDYHARRTPAYEARLQNRGSQFAHTYLRVRPGTDVEALEAEVAAFRDARASNWEARHTDVQLDALPALIAEEQNTHVYGWMLVAMALGILGMAATNVTNLATARSMQRAREVGTRKALGAGRPRLIRQFLVETLLITGVAVGLGLVLAEGLAPIFPQILDFHIGLDYTPALFAGFLGGAVGLAIVAGGYPAFYLSRFDPSAAIREQHHQQPGGRWLRNGLVVFQFTASILLIAAALVFYQQLGVLQAEGPASTLGDREILVTTVDPDLFDSAEAGRQRLETLRQTLVQQPAVENVTLSTKVPGTMDDWSARISPSRDTDVDIRVHFLYVDTSFFDVYNAQRLDGRSFRASDTGCTAVINAAARDALGWDTIDGRTFEMMDTCTVVGVVENNPYAALHEPLKPLVHLYMTDDVPHYNHVSVVLAPGATAEGLASARAVWNDVVPGQVFEHSFLHDRLDRLYAVERALAPMVGYAALFALLIAGMGLLGLSALTVSRRRREIGIRKVLGATIGSIIRTLSSNLALLLVVACGLAAPLAYVLLDAWLQHYAVRTSLGLWTALGIGGGGLLLVLATVALQTVQTARIDPASVVGKE